MAIKAISVEEEYKMQSEKVATFADMMIEQIKESVRIYERDNPDYKFDRVEYDYNGGLFKLNVLFKHRMIN